MSLQAAGRVLGSLCVGLSAFAALPQVSTAQSVICGTSFDPYFAGTAAAKSCGLHVHPLAQTQPLPDGGTAYIYNVDGGETVTYRQPPASFDPSTASDTRLVYYGMLPHPTGLDGLAAWQRVVKTPRPHPPAFLVQGPTPISQPQTTSPGGGVNTSTSLNWSGYVDSGSSFTDMKTDYLEETPAGSQPCSNNAISQWAGIGGVNSGNLAQDGTALHEGYAGIPDHGAWAEVLPNGPIYMHFTVNAGDEVQADVQHYGSGFEFTVADLTTGNSYGFFHTTSSYDGSTADAILERPYNGVGGYTTPLTQFSSPDEFFFADPNGNPLNQYTHTDYAMYSQSTGHELAHPGSVFSSDDFYDYYDNCG